MTSLPIVHVLVNIQGRYRVVPIASSEKPRADSGSLLACSPHLA
jgi:hypothetical protein